MANKKFTVWVVHEREGPSILQGFTTEEDANNWFNWEVANGNSHLDQYYAVKSIEIEDCSKQG